MQLSSEAQVGLERRLTIQIPEHQIVAETALRLQKLVQKVKIDGFRPGKVPLRVVQQRYGGQVRDEVFTELADKSIEQAVSKQALRVVGPPKIEPIPAAPGMGVQFTAVFEVYPEITLPDFSQVSIQRPIASVGDADIDAMIEKLRQQRTHWHPVDRPAIMGDKLSMWMQESILGSEHTPLAQDRELTLGAPTALPAVYDALLGVVAGESREFTITLPEDHPQAAGKQVHFDVKVKQVAEPHVPDMDEALVQTFGVASGSLETFRSEVRANMERELQQAIRKSLKNQVMDVLVQLGHSVPLPQTLVEQEASQLAQDSELQALPGQASAQSPIPQALFRERAERRVLLGLMLGQIVAENKIQLDDARLHSTLKTLAASYEHPEDVLRWYYTHPEELRGIRSVALEEQAVNWLLERAQVSEQPLGFFELVQPK